MPDYGQSLFEGTVHYFAKYRPAYPSALIRLIVERFRLEGSGKMLDLGSGTGQLTCRFADWFDTIIGLDNQTEMLEEARRISQELRFSNIDWVQGKAENFLKKQEKESVQLVTMAKAFHWMDREEVLDALFPIIQSGGGLAVIDDYEPDPILEPWQEVMEEVIAKWYGNMQRAGDTTFKPLEKSHEEVIAASAFELEVHQLQSYTYTWTPESIIGHHYSTSYGAKRFLGDNTAAFEKELEDKLFQMNPAGIFEEKKTVTVLLGVKP